MGLDSYFRIKAYNNPGFTFDRDLNLCGGLLSGHGNDGSFRGKVYNRLIEHVTGYYSLYTEELDHESVVAIAKKLEETPYDPAWATDPAVFPMEYPISEEEYKDLVDLFKAAASTDNCVLLGWW